MKKRRLRRILGIGYVLFLAMLLLYQAGVFGCRRNWGVAVFGTLILGAALLVVLALYIRVNNQLCQIQAELSERAAKKQADESGTAPEKPEEKQQNTARKPSVPGGSFEEIYAHFLSVLEACALSERELEVAWLLYRGYTNRQIGESLFIAESTVKKHVSHIYEKMGVQSRKEFRARVTAGLP